LVGVAINDRGDDALSAVYCYYDPDYAKLSLGAYSILKAIDVCRTWGLRYLYLGLYIAACNPMRYKATYFPHERLIDGKWQRFELRG
jgi:arginine-tRNA-protein transferase